MAHLSGSEILMVLIILVSGLIGNIVMKYPTADSKRYKKWNYSVYGGAIIFLVCGVLTPPDILSNIIFSIPLITIYQIIIRKYYFKSKNN